MRSIHLHVMGHWISPPGTLGGITRILIEFAKRWCLDPNIRITIHTSTEGAQTLDQHGVPQEVFRCVWQSASFAWSYNPWNHARQVLAAVRNTSKITSASDSQLLIYSATEFWPDVIPAALLRRHFAEAKWLAGFYLFAPSPFQGYKGAYGPRQFTVPDWRLVLNKYFYQRLSLALIVRYADMLFITNQSDAPFFIQRGFSSEQLRAIYGGVDLAEVSSVRAAEKSEFAGCFVGRLHQQKGIEDLLQIWRLVCQHTPSRLAIIGNTLDSEYETRMRKLCTALGLDNYVEWLGYVDGIKKYEVLKRSRVFLHPTVYDNSGMAAAEGMAAGLPAVAYDLPPLRIPYPMGMLKVPPRDREAFAQAVIALLTDPILYQATQKEALDLARDWDWGKRAQTALDWIFQNPSL